MLEKSGYLIARVAEIPWEERRNVDGWPSSAGMYYNDVDNNLCMRLIDRGLGRLLLELVEFDAAQELRDPKITAAFVVDGAAAIDGESLHARDFFYVRKDMSHEAVRFPEHTTLLTVTMR